MGWGGQAWVALNRTVPARRWRRPKSLSGDGLAALETVNRRLGGETRGRSLFGPLPTQVPCPDLR
ncbi:MAG: hypothetical protein QOI06_3449 [Nocardioidaceae bacterium]|jgi:hypothetical protein|nr:hypothetical protein [Nocardioidaceae bacterium]